MTADVVRETIDWIVSKNFQVYEGETAGGALRRALVVLPPIAAEVVSESKHPGQLVPVAVQLRERYRKLREWLKAVQAAVDSDDVRAFLKYQRTLAAVGRDVDRLLGKSGPESISVSIGMSGIGMGLTVPVLDGVLRRFGVRSMLNKLVFAPSGRRALHNLLKMFGEDRSRLGFQATDYFQNLGSLRR